jgi:hypothetical protein
VAASVPVVEPELKAPSERISKARKKESAAKMKPTENKETVEWLRKRMYPTMDESLAASVN